MSYSDTGQGCRWHSWGWLGTALLLSSAAKKKKLGTHLEGQSSSGGWQHSAIWEVNIQEPQTCPAQPLCPQQEGQQREAGITEFLPCLVFWRLPASPPAPARVQLKALRCLHTTGGGEGADVSRSQAHLEQGAEVNLLLVPADLVQHQEGQDSDCLLPCAPQGDGLLGSNTETRERRDKEPLADHRQAWTSLPPCKKAARREGTQRGHRVLSDSPFCPHTHWDTTKQPVQ